MNRKFIPCAVFSILLASCGNTDSQRPEDTQSISLVEQAIINGTAALNEPYTVALFEASTPPDQVPDDYHPIVSASAYCTGTLIHPQWVLTAAHCIADIKNGTPVAKEHNDKTYIGIGDTQGKLKVYKPAGKTYFYFHEDFQDKPLISHDIALIKLKTPIAEADAKPVLPLPTWFALTNQDLPKNLDASGFGYDEKGNYGEKNTRSMSTTAYCGQYNKNDSENGCYIGLVNVKGCHPNKTYCEQHGTTNAIFNISIPYGTFYTPTDKGGQCNGDSGGPLYTTVGGIRYVAGVTSYGDQSCRGYTIVTSVQDYQTWIMMKAPEVVEQYKEICNNNVDDDGNSLVDKKDPKCMFCGNNVLNVGESCDGSLFAGNKTKCSEWNSSHYGAGNVSCNNNCTINYDACKPASDCGNGKVEDGEECDGNSFNNNRTKCVQWDLNYSGGNVTCTSNCTINTSQCVTETRCGDGVVSGGEFCDGNAFMDDLDSCNEMYPQLFSGGKLKCNKDCIYDISGCTSYCGNGSVDTITGEACDHGKAGDVFPSYANTCTKVMGTGSTGTLKCTSNCAAIDTSGCKVNTKCGNGKLDSGEECDGTVFSKRSKDCSAWNSKYAYGEVICNQNCTINYSYCIEGTICGDGKKDWDEMCDGNDITPNLECKMLIPDLFSGGIVTCDDDCGYNLDACILYCGNGVIDKDRGEICDPGIDKAIFDPSKDTCEKVVGPGSTGQLVCSADCQTIYKVGCTQPNLCGNNKLDSDEVCDGNLFKGNKSLCSQWDNTYTSGNVKCNNCKLDYSDCSTRKCGNNILDEGEECDGTLFRGNVRSCKVLEPDLYNSGEVTCMSICMYDFSDCIGDEVCDNLEDDDGDTIVDCDDLDCFSSPLCNGTVPDEGGTDPYIPSQDPTTPQNSTDSQTPGGPSSSQDGIYHPDNTYPYGQNNQRPALADDGFGACSAMPIQSNGSVPGFLMICGLGIGLAVRRRMHHSCGHK